MIIRIPNINEHEIVNNLAVQVHELHVGWRPDLFNSVDEVITLDEFTELIQNKEIYVSVIDNKVVGYIVFCIVEKISQNNKFRYRKQLNVDAMCVDENYRGKGIGTALLNFIEKIAVNNECTDMYLTVNKENVGAIKIYENFGMRVKNIAYSKRLKNKIKTK
ncbi:MAG: GNAT family N-acetyltransferase [Bacilli bacterium]|nr:GNAT family N-acetyltransferase [Bacilli bacterium]